MAIPAQQRRVLVGLGIAVIALLALWALVAAIRGFMGDAKPPKKQVAQEVRIIRPPPPPPPEEKPPPPPPPEEKVDLPEPEPEPDPVQSDEPPPGEQLGVDAEGGAGGDGFGLVGRKGGRDLLASGGSAYAWYAGLLKNEILGELNTLDEVRAGSYSIVVRVWVRPDGSIERVRIVQSSGNRDRDRAIEAALSKIERISQAPPADMPQPVSLRIVSRA
jgi:protein TonB